MKPKIIYVFDPMCGWCYGFSKVMDQFYKENKSKYDFEIISGGMVVGEREGPIGGFANYILSAIKRVEEYSGMTFGEPYLDQLRTQTLWTSSVTPSEVIETFKQYYPEEVIPFASAVQRAHFYDGLDLRDHQSYQSILEKYQIDQNDFWHKQQSDEIKEMTIAGFQTSANWGITGFPCVVMQVDQQLFAIARGYTDLNNLTLAAAKLADR